MQASKSWDDWKLEGDKLCRTKHFYRAIECYDQALKRVSREGDALVLLLNRCHARVSSQHFDSALQDAKAVLHSSPGNEKALFRAAKALYGLRRYKESHEQLNKMIKLYPKNQEAVRDLQRCQARLREETGRYKFGELLDEAVAKSPRPDMDHASYTGPIEVRQCDTESHGRGCFTTKAVKAGDLLLVEKAFSAVYPDDDESGGQSDPPHSPEGKKRKGKLRSELATSTFIRLHRNPSLATAFSDLYPGPDAVDDIDDNGDPVINDAFIQYRIMYNAFAFPTLSKDWKWRARYDRQAIIHDPVNRSSSIGIWLKASYINHACYANVRRSFIGDIMLWRALQDVPANTELKFGYVSGNDDYDGRQSVLNNYGFICECQICLSEKNTPSETITRREQIYMEIISTFESPTPSGIDVYFTLLTKLQSTYIFSPRIEPRRSLIVPIANLMNVARAETQPGALIRLGIMLLNALGFTLEVTPTTWRIKEWGYVCDEIVAVLADVWLACGTLQPALCEGLERDARTSYCMMAGEEESFDGAYRGWKPKIMKDMDSAAGMEVLKQLRHSAGIQSVEEMLERMKLGEDEKEREAVKIDDSEAE